jgi:hypothetical protein
MGLLEVVFEVPPAIEYGLSSGVLERVGGVIRDSASKQVIAWLRDGSLIETGSNTLLSAVNPVSIVFKAVDSVSTLHNNYVTRAMIGQIGKQMIGGLGNLTSSVSLLTSLTLGGHLVNLSLSALTLATVNSRMQALSSQIESMGEKILAEFEKDREINYYAALDAALDVFGSQNGQIRDAAHRAAIDGLSKARRYAMDNHAQAFKYAPDRKYLQLAQYFLLNAIYVELTRIRCYLAMGDRDTAIQRFTDTKAQFCAAIDNLVQAWLGKNGAIYFHKEIPAHNLVRYLRIQQRLRGVSGGDHPLAIFEIIDEMRSQFWDDAVFEGENDLLRKIGLRGASRIDPQQQELLADNLLQVEILLENLDRMEGFELEMRSVRLEFQEWESIVSEEQLNEYGSALIIDTEMLERLQIG